VRTTARQITQSEDEHDDEDEYDSLACDAG
jgi:hypothetical protein